MLTILREGNMRLLLLPILCIILISLISCGQKQDYLNTDIIPLMKSGLQDDGIKQIYAEDIADVYELTSAKIININYFGVDLNSDGYEDKIVIVSSPLHSGSQGDTFDILLNDGNGGYADISGISVIKLHEQFEISTEAVGSKIYISDQKTSGFHDIVIESPEYDTITLKYDGVIYGFSKSENIE